MPSVENIDFVQLLGKLIKWPLGLGQWVISIILFFFAPYTSTIYPSIPKLDYGECWMQAKDKWLLHNPFGSFHAAALANLAEGSATLCLFTACTAAGKKDGATFMAIPTRMDMHYLIKSKGTIVSKCKVDPDTLIQAAKTNKPVEAIAEIWEVKGRNGQEPRKLCYGKFEFNIKRKERKSKSN